MFLTCIVSIPILKAADDPIPPPVEKRRYVCEVGLDPLYDSKVEWHYPAEGLFTWVVTASLEDRSFFAYLTCHNPVKNGQKETHLVAAYAKSYIYVHGRQWQFGWVDEYHNFDRAIKLWHFSASLKENYEPWQLAIFICFDDLEENPPIIAAYKQQQNNHH
ncbi:hypothetical protein [uncultured Duncaniella sp.]|uniref:hypothetical protein n=1 Tax=uncultured Duncaniella sp. TaxID=2768039 RepID=UPI00272F530B|nr:hypothetical protein [uncultured Duncaniella sp.]